MPATHQRSQMLLRSLAQPDQSVLMFVDMSCSSIDCLPVVHCASVQAQSALTTDGAAATCDASSCAVTTALTAAALSVIGYYDWKIAVTTLTVVVVLGALRRIFKMIIASEDALPIEEGY